jgi:hypothetical protein
MDYQIGEGVRAAIAERHDTPQGDEVFNDPDQRFSTTPGLKYLYITHKTYDTDDQHTGFEVYVCPKA